MGQSSGKGITFSDSLSHAEQNLPGLTLATLRRNRL